mmetsp:Transcript_26921/g.63878  ORF Transcript_26921/g.63878 Transcript_26921/m.63878 type:complete len:289 (+) Transcript_26921:58-924(+)
MNLVLIRKAEQSDGGSVALASKDERSVHIVNHLGKKTGDTVSFGIYDGPRGKATVTVDDGGGVRLTPVQETMVPPEPEPEITVLLAVPFPMRMKWLWPVMASFNYVTRIVVIRGELSNHEFCDSRSLREGVYGPLIEKGMSQGARTRGVKVDVCFENVSADLLGRLGLGDNSAARALLDCGDENNVPKELYGHVDGFFSDAHGRRASGVGSCPAATLAVGPERGWTEKEAKIFTDFGFASTSLGSSILRVDTAVVAGLGIVTAALDKARRRGATLEECQTAKVKRPRG